MLLNPFSLVMLFIAFISIILIFYGSVPALRTKGNWYDYGIDSEKESDFERKIKPVLFLASMVLALRLLSYPLFYVTLQSFVKTIDGAMCIYGVTEVLPCLFKFLEITKPVVFFFAGQWLIFHSLTKFGKARSIMFRKLMFLLVVTGGALIDSGGDLVFFLRMNSHTPVTCCTPNIDFPDRTSALLTGYLWGNREGHALLKSYYISNLVLLGTAGYLILKKRIKGTAILKKRTLGLVFLMGILNLFLTGLALREEVGPKMMNLPFHHCFYCLFQYVPDSCLMIGLLITGTFGFGWAFGLKMISGDKKTGGNLPEYLNTLYRLSFFCLSFSLAMVSLHIFRAGQ